jgi:RNA polymerase sigma-70 factor (ECF subfamily)
MAKVVTENPQEPDHPQPGLPSDAELVRRTVDGDRRAFDVLIRRYQRQAVAVSFRLLGNTSDALEVTQDAFLKGFMSIASLQKPDAFAGWLMRIVSNLSLNYRRSRKSRSAMPLDDIVVGGEAVLQEKLGPVRELAGRELGERTREALEQLPEKQRLAIVMFTIDELPQKQVAEALNCSVEAVKWHVFQARKKLRELLKDQLAD